MSEYSMKFIPSTEKCFMDDTFDSKPEITRLSMMRNERLGFQLCYTKDGSHPQYASSPALEIDFPFPDKLRICRVEQVPVQMPVYQGLKNDNYLRTEPGLYPDLLLPYEKKARFLFVTGELRSLFFFLEDENGLTPGDYTLTVRAKEGGEIRAEASLVIHVVNAMLPESTFKHTQWFHYDGLAQYYGVKVFSEKHWKIVENFAAEAVKAGINMILTPVFTPALDTAVGTERLTAQLIDVTVTEDGGYLFGFEKFDRFVKTMTKVGMKYFEIAHLYTQWGCAHAPKIMAKVKGRTKRIFGWETDAHGPEYRAFVRAFLTAFVAHVKALGIDKKCYYHISDEPRPNHIEAYLNAKETIGNLLDGYVIMDALSDYALYESGAVQKPIPSLNHLDTFVEHKVPDLWTYYCCSQSQEVPNRFMAMPGARTRIIGTMFYKYDLKGFLQWGFNFYNSSLSYYPVNPFSDTCGDYMVPAGDTFSVYPGDGGKPWRSLHGVQFTEALTDLRALRLCESLIGREKTMELLEEGLDRPITVFDYPKEQEYILAFRERINHAIENAIG